MPSPYSDNLYSAADSSDDEADALSPTDGYFHASSDLASSSSHLQSPFHRSAGSVPRVPNVFVEDPTLPDPGSKAREAEAERSLNSGSTDSGDPTVSPSTASAGYQPSRFVASPPSHHHRRSVEEQHNPYAGLDQQITSPYMGQQPPSVSTALLSHHRDAPPAYTPSPTSPPNTSYQTFAPSNSTMGLPEEQQRLIPRGPESMGGPPSPQDPSRWQRIKSSITGIDLRKKLKTALGVLVIFSVVAIILGSATMPPKHKDHGIDDDQPVKKPNMDHSDFVWNPARSCLNRNLKHHKSTTSLDMHYKSNLTIIQKVNDDDEHVSGWSPRVTGEIILRPTDDASPGTLELEIIANDDKIKTEFDKDEQTFKIITPRKVPWTESEGPCIQIRVTVWAPRKAIINSLNIDTVHLDVAIREGLILGVLEPAIIRTVVGDVRTPAPKNDKTRDEEDVVPYTLASRVIHISTTSGDVEGWYPLYDVLDIRSASGDISTEVGTKPVDPQAVRPAVLRVHSISGQISIQEALDSAVSAARPDREFPPRDYVVDISTASGDVSAEIAFSSRAIFESQSGDLKLRLWPVLDSGLLKRGASQKPVLKTTTTSGETKVKLLEPLWTSLAGVGNVVPGDIPGGKEPYIIPAPNHGKEGPGEDFIVADDPKHSNRGSDDEFGIADTPSFSVLTSGHASISGGVKLEYPSSWEGRLTATTISGKQNVRGEGLHVDNNSSGPWSRRLRGTKGNGNSQLTIDTVSGDEDVLIGADVGSKSE
ncbi:hypothetical protein B0J13DRAFT_275018 [Dactylonectria estremocensis]|uniref:Adhesin domain-containing protein n=1 Tax=Dactylonectria estremocensis TaxID=1079267 RepID=A0A9P9EXT4_9HYPO|nr:hypothetical protein B0J13DRAFT_275018 [Dactylonectria estremocensis]